MPPVRAWGIALDTEEERMPAKKLPKAVYVCWEFPSNGDPYLECSPSPQSFGEDGTQVGVYQLKQTKIKRVRETLEDP